MKFVYSFRNCISCVNNCEDLLYIYYKKYNWPELKTT